MRCISGFLGFVLCLGLLGAVWADGTGKAGSGTAGSELVRTYDQTIIVEYDSPDQAGEKTEIQALELPPGKILASTSRWDDTNNEHLQMLKTLNDNGWHGTFYINSISEDYASRVVRPMLESGSSVGAHTVTHPTLSTVTPNAMFYEVLANRVAIETATDSCVTTFTFPNGLRANVSDPDSLGKMGRTLIRAGLYGAAEPQDVANKIGLMPNEFVASHLYRADDRNPQQAVFDQGFNQGLDKLKTGRLKDCGPGFVLGVHSWQRSIHKDGFDRLSKIISTRSNNPLYWYCNMNEYVAWRLNYLNSRFETAKQAEQAGQATQKTVFRTFKITRLEPAELGATLDLGVRISPAPKKVTLVGSDQPLQSAGEDMYMIPNAPDKKVPTVIGLAGKDGSCSKIPGVSLSLSLADGQQLAERQQLDENLVLCVRAKNETGSAMENLNFTLRLPLGYETGVVKFSQEKLESGESVTKTFPLGAMKTDSDYRSFALYFCCQLDFVEKSERACTAKRLYSVYEHSYPVEAQPVPRDTAMCVGPEEAETFDAAAMAACSVPGAQLKPISETSFGTWRGVNRAVKSHPSVLFATNANNGSVKRPGIAYAVQFEAAEDQTLTLKAGPDRQLTKVWLNGRELDKAEWTAFKPQKNTNRLILLFVDSWTYCIHVGEVSITDSSTGVSVKFCSVE